MNHFWIKQWEEKKHLLEANFRAEMPESYEEIVRRLFTLVVTDFDSCEKFSINRMVRIDHGDYQGTEIYLIPSATYQPNMLDYVVFDNEYGSCSGCDTLEHIRSQSDYGEEKATDKQIQELMTLALHMVQRMKVLGKTDETD